MYSEAVHHLLHKEFLHSHSRFIGTWWWRQISPPKHLRWPGGQPQHLQEQEISAQPQYHECFAPSVEPMHSTNPSGERQHEGKPWPAQVTARPLSHWGCVLRQSCFTCDHPLSDIHSSDPFTPVCALSSCNFRISFLQVYINTCTNKHILFWLLSIQQTPDIALRDLLDTNRICDNIITALMGCRALKAPHLPRGTHSITECIALHGSTAITQLPAITCLLISKEKKLNTVRWYCCWVIELLLATSSSSDCPYLIKTPHLTEWSWRILLIVFQCVISGPLQVPFIIPKHIVLCLLSFKQLFFLQG